MTKSCVQCGRFVGSIDGAKCFKCSSLYHRDCAKLSPNAPIPKKWICCHCNKDKNKVSDTKAISTPNLQVLSTPNLIPASTASAGPSMQDDSTNSIVAELRLLRSEMTCFSEKITQLNVTISVFNSRMVNIEGRLSKLEEQSAARELNGTDNLQDIVTKLQNQLNDRDQDLLLNDVQISGLKETPGENLMSMTSLLAKKLGVDLDDRDVVAVERSGPRRVGSDSAGDGVMARQRPRPIVVRFARRATRDNLLRAARVRRGADTSGIIATDSVPTRFYVNEHLTRANKQLFYKARELGSNKNWRYIWTKGGRVYIRQSATTPVHRVRSEADMMNFFGNPTF